MGHSYTPITVGVANLTGEIWFFCPRCSNSFEYSDIVHERKGIHAVGRNMFVCSKCGKVIRIG